MTMFSQHWSDDKTDLERELEYERERREQWHGQQQAEEVERLQARVEQLEAALRPFADAYYSWLEYGMQIFSSGQLGPVRIPLNIEPYDAAAAAAALTQTAGEE